MYNCTVFPAEAGYTDLITLSTTEISFGALVEAHATSLKVAHSIPDGVYNFSLT